MMTKGRIEISGFTDKEPKTNKEGAISLMIKVPHFNEIGIDNHGSYCLVIIDKQKFGRINQVIDDNTFYYIEGSFKVGKNTKEIPFLTVRCENIRTTNLLRKEFVSDNVKLTDDFPFETEELMDLSRITIKDNFNNPTLSKQKAMNYLFKHGNFERTILLRREDLSIREGYEYYIIAKELGIEKVPVSYLQQYCKPLEHNYINIVKNWDIDEPVINVSVRDIVLVEEIHLKTKNFVFHHNLDEYKRNYINFSPVIVRPIENNKYALVAGASRYFSAKIMDIQEIPAVIKDMDHDKFIEYSAEKHKTIEQKNSSDLQAKEVKKPTVSIEEIAMSSITVPENFASTPPRAEKVNEAIEYYKKHGEFDKPIVVKGDSYIVIDGYKRYVAAKQLKLEKILAKVIK
jgi:hypothetical protein